MTYKLYNDPFTNELGSIKRTNDDVSISFIPLDTDNTDYQEYLKWVEEGNTAEEDD